MDSSMESPQTPLVVFGADHIDTSRAEMLVQCLNNKIKEKRFKLQKLVGTNEEKKKRNELMEKEKIQLTTKLANIEHENCVREQQLESEQVRIKELQLNIQLLDDHNSSVKRDHANEEHKFEQEKTLLINKFEHVKQQWTEVFKPQYEQSKVYQYLKQGDSAYNSLVERKENLLNSQKKAFKDYLLRRREFCNEKKFQSSILSIAKYFISRRDQLFKIETMKTKLIELKNKQKQLIESKMDKIKAWENIYTQPMKRDLLDFCLQSNIDQALTLTFTQMHQDIFSQPMTPIIVSALTPQNEQIKLVLEEQTNKNSFTTSDWSKEPIVLDQSANKIDLPLSHQEIASTIEIIPNVTKNAPIQSNRVSVLHLTTAIDDDDELFSKPQGKIPTIQMEQMTINDLSSSTQAFTVSKPTKNTTLNTNKEVFCLSENTDQSSQQIFIVDSVSAQSESIPVHNFITSAINDIVHETTSNVSIDTAVNKLHPTVTFQVPHPLIQNRPVISTTSSIQPQVTSSDVQQMLLTFSPDPSSIIEEQPQPMEEDSQQIHQQQPPIFSIASSTESTTNIEDGYTNFNYNFGFDNEKTNDANTVCDGNFTSPVNFVNWSNLGSTITIDSNDQFPVFLQQSDNNNNGVDTSFSFAAFNFAGISDNGTPTDGAFGSFFFSNNESPNNSEQTYQRTNN